MVKNNNWPTKKLGEICEFIFGYSFPAKLFNKERRGLPIIKTGDIKNNFCKEFYDGDYDKKYLVNPGDILIGLSGTIISGTWRGNISLLNQRVVKLNNFTSNVNKNFIGYILPPVLKNLEATLWKAAVKNILKHHLENLEVPLPPLPIQQKIVSILDTIQSAIDIQNKIIETTKELKKSMMADLFKYGGPSFRKGRKLKKTEIGEIPEDWEVVRLGEICERKLRNIFPKDFPNEEFEYYSIPNFHERKQPVLVLGKEVGSSKWLVTPGIVLFGKLNPKLPKIWIVNNYFPGHRKIATTEFLPLMCGNKISPFFLYYLLWSDYVLPLTFEMASGSTTSRQRINPNLFYELKIPLPPLPEQHEIADILQTIDQKIEIEKKKKELYEELFKTMLNKLMNGEIDVEKIEI